MKKQIFYNIYESINIPSWVKWLWIATQSLCLNWSFLRPVLPVNKIIASLKCVTINDRQLINWADFWMPWEYDHLKLVVSGLCQQLHESNKKSTKQPIKKLQIWNDIITNSHYQVAQNRLKVATNCSFYENIILLTFLKNFFWIMIFWRSVWTGSLCKFINLLKICNKFAANRLLDFMTVIA